MPCGSLLALFVLNSPAVTTTGLLPKVATSGHFTLSASLAARASECHWCATREMCRRNLLILLMATNRRRTISRGKKMCQKKTYKPNSYEYFENCPPHSFPWIASIASLDRLSKNTE